MKQGIFVTGTDTGVGKTLVSSLLVSALLGQGKKANYFKPVQTGSDLDTPRVAHLSGIKPVDLIHPVYSFQAPASPHRAAALENQEIRIDLIRETWNQIQGGHWVVEGAGGLLVPLNSNQTIRDLIQALQLPVLVVASARLGTINHTLLTLEAARSAQISVRGIVLSGSEDPGLESVFEQLTAVPVIARVPTLTEESPQQVQSLAQECFRPTKMRCLYDI